MRLYRFLLLFLISFSAAGGYAQVGPFAPSSSDSMQIRSSTKFRVAVGGGIAYASPVKYGLSGGVYIGRFILEDLTYQNNPVRTQSTFRGVNINAGYYRGGYQLGIYYFDFDSFVSAAGFKLGAVYYETNSFSSRFKNNQLAGIEAELYIMFKLKAGILSELNGERFIPILGIGIPFGPDMYKR